MSGSMSIGRVSFCFSPCSVLFCSGTFSSDSFCLFLSFFDFFLDFELLCFSGLPSGGGSCSSWIASNPGKPNDIRSSGTSDGLFSDALIEALISAAKTSGGGCFSAAFVFERLLFLLLSLGNFSFILFVSPTAVFSFVSSCDSICDTGG